MQKTKSRPRSATVTGQQVALQVNNILAAVVYLSDAIAELNTLMEQMIAAMKREARLASGKRKD